MSDIELECGEYYRNAKGQIIRVMENCTPIHSYFTTDHNTYHKLDGESIGIHADHLEDLVNKVEIYDYREGELIRPGDMMLVTDANGKELNVTGVMVEDSHDETP